MYQLDHTLHILSRPHPLTCHYCVVLDGPSYNHDCIVERSLRLFNKLLCSPSQDQRASLSLRATSEDVVPGEDDMKCVDMVQGRRVAAH